MATIINGTDNTAVTPALTGADTDTGVFFPAANTTAFSNAGVEAARFDSSGNLGLGTTAPQQKLSVAGNINLTNGSNRFLQIGSSTNYSYDVMMSGDDFQIREAQNDSKIRLRIKYNATASLAGQLQLPIDGSATLYNSYTARAWVNFNGSGTVAIRASGNVSSITDLGTGYYRINYTTAMPDANYCVTQGPASIGSGVANLQNQGLSTTRVDVQTRYEDGTLYDWSELFIAIFR
jgi:hypothetical protein